MPLFKRDAADLEGLVEALVGRSIVHVRYHNALGSEDWPVGYACGAIDEVDQALALILDNEVAVVATWGWAPVNEGLSVRIVPAAEAETGTDETAVESISGWRRFLGRPILAVRADWFVREGTERLCSLRVTFGEGSVSISLGRIADGGLEYYPHGLLVFYDEAIAQADCPHVPN